jgi:hypothetical protein
MNCLTPWGNVLEKPIVIEVVKKFLTFYGNQRFITMLTSLSLELNSVHIHTSQS